MSAPLVHKNQIIFSICFIQRDGGEVYEAGQCGDPYPCEKNHFLSGVYSDCTGKEENLGHCNGLSWDRFWRWDYKPLAVHCYEPNENSKLLGFNSLP